MYAKGAKQIYFIQYIYSHNISVYLHLKIRADWRSHIYLFSLHAVGMQYVGPVCVVIGADECERVPLCAAPIFLHSLPDGVRAYEIKGVRRSRWRTPVANKNAAAAAGALFYSLLSPLVFSQTQRDRLRKYLVLSSRYKISADVVFAIFSHVPPHKTDLTLLPSL